MTLLSTHCLACVVVGELMNYSLKRIVTMR